MPNQNYVLIMRKWDNPQIQISVSREADGGISVSCPLDSFLAACVEEIGNPTLLISKAQLLDKLKKAADASLSEVKAETSRVM